MHLTTANAGRALRPAFAVVMAALLLLVLLSGGARAAGTGGIEVTPDPPVVDGKTQTNFKVAVPSDGQQRVPFIVRNTTEEQRSARLYTAEVTRPDGDALQLGSAGSSEVVELESQTVTLEPGEVRRMHFTVEGQELPDEVLAAVVVEVGTGSVVQRAATLIYLREGRQVPLPLLILAAAVVLLAVAGAGVALMGRRRPADDTA